MPLHFVSVMASISNSAHASDNLWLSGFERTLEQLVWNGILSPFSLDERKDAVTIIKDVQSVLPGKNR